MQSFIQSVNCLCINWLSCVGGDNWDGKEGAQLLTALFIALAAAICRVCVSYRLTLSCLLKSFDVCVCSRTFTPRNSCEKQKLNAACLQTVRNKTAQKKSGNSTTVGRSQTVESQQQQLRSMTKEDYTFKRERSLVVSSCFFLFLLVSVFFFFLSCVVHKISDW